MVRQRTSAPTSGAPSKKARTQTDNPVDDPTNRILESNRFSVLPEDGGSGEAIAKKERIPSLFTPEDIGQLKTELSKYKLQPRFKLCSIGTKILCSSLAEYKAVGTLLKSSGAEFYTHDMPSAKPLKVVLRGLPPFEAEDVQTELERLGLKPVAVHLMTRRLDSNSNFRDQLFLVHLVKGSTTIAALKSNIRDLFQVIVSWEPYRPQHRDVTQCTNCLACGHGTKNCHMKPRCDKCAGEHKTASCDQKDDTEPKCANCGSNHRATNRICAKRADFIRIRQKATTRNQPGRQHSVRLPPAHSDAQYPALQPRRVVPNLESLPLNNQQTSSAPAVNPPMNQAIPNHRSAQPRLAAAAAQPSLGASPLPGLSYARVTSGVTADDTPFTSDELVTLVAEVIIILRTCRTRSEQLHAALSLVSKYGP